MMLGKTNRRKFFQKLMESVTGLGLLNIGATGQPKHFNPEINKPEKSFFSEQNLFAAGDNGYHTYRIPSIIVTAKGSLIAFCEARKKDGADSGDIDLVFRRSQDQGKTWSNQQILWDDAENTCGNPCSVVDQKTNTIHLLLTRNLGVDHEAQIVAGTSQGTRTVWHCQSTDDGKTWSQPTEITESVKAADWGWYATGPGVGIQLANGRLVVPCDHTEKRTSFSHIIFSDDHGRSWQRGGQVPDGNECEVIELADGRLMLNMRNANRSFKNRAISISSDQGMSWSELKRDAQLMEPICQASIRRYSRLDKKSGQNRILFSNPASSGKRENMTVRVSTDEGETWSAGKMIYAGPAAYSCLAVAADKTIFCLYERGQKTPYEQITLAKFNLAWLIRGKSE